MIKLKLRHTFKKRRLTFKNIFKATLFTNFFKLIAFVEPQPLTPRTKPKPSDKSWIEILSKNIKVPDYKRASDSSAPFASAQYVFKLTEPITRTSANFKVC